MSLKKNYQSTVSGVLLSFYNTLLPCDKLLIGTSDYFTWL